MDADRTSTRIRRTFAYPSDDAAPTSDSNAALDEQEQEDLITSLSSQNSNHNVQFRLFLLAVPLLSTIPYLMSLFQPHATNRFIAILALNSLGSTAWTLYALPPGVTGIRALDQWAAGTGAEDTIHGDHGTHISMRNRRRRGSFSLTGAVTVDEQKSPLQTWLPYLNLGLCGMLMLTSLFSKAHAPQHWGHVGLGNLPAVVYVVILAAKVVMGSVDPERELSGLKYEYKGA
ncbi:hypothetical protein BJ170DRAFT_481272 [Xylariales sp. AK1849]|nr:hypothetical protein BJ170DRAFT_481272 [Xylariales sp. AK1849]